MLLPDDEREATIRSLLPMVRKMARRIHRLVPSMDADDLIGEGCIGLIRAVDAFDPNRGPALRHYAARLALGKMLNGVRRMDPVSERVRRELRDAERQRFQIASQTGALPNPVEMEKIRPELAEARLHAHLMTPLSIHRPFPDGLELPVDHAGDPARVWTHAIDRSTLMRLLDTLTERQRRVLVLHYYAERSLRDIAAQFKISPQRCSQLHSRAITKLRRVHAT